MFDLKNEYSILKPKYIDNDNYLYISKNKLAYNSSPCVSVYKFISTPLDYSTLVKVSEIQSFDILSNHVGINDDIEMSYNLNITNDKKYEDIIISKDFFDVLNTIVSCGITPLDIGKFTILNGEINIIYITLDYSIKFKFNIQNKSVALDSYITFDVFWYLYSFFKEFSEKKSDFIIKITSIDNGYVLNINNVFLSFNDMPLNKLFISGVIDAMSNVKKNNKNVFSKKYFIENNSGSLYKNILKCFSEEITVYETTKYKIISSDNVEILVGNKKVKDE